MVGVFFSLMAAVFLGAGGGFARAGVLFVRPTIGTFISLVVGSTVFLIVALVFDFDGIKSLTGTAFLWCALAGFSNYAIGRLFQYTGLSLAGASRGAPFLGAVPLFVALYAVVFLGETLTPPILIGTLAIVAGAIFIVSER